MPHGNSMLANSVTSLAALAVVFAVLLWRRRVSCSRLDLPLPPGPRPLPLIGNLLDVPAQDMEVHFRDMNDQYGTCRLLQFVCIPFID